MPIDLQKEIRKHRKIYVRNKSNPRGAVFLTLFDVGNRPIQIQIPPTPHPYCLSDNATDYSMVDGGFNLKQYLTKGVLTLISQAKAEKILRDPAVKAELRAAIDSTRPSNDKTKAYRNKREPSGSLAQAAGVAPDGTPLVVNASGLHANSISDQPIRMEVDEDDEDSNINPQVRVIIANFHTKELSSKDARFRLSQISDQLVEEDLAYINDNTSGQLREYAQQCIAKLRGLSSDEDDDDDDDGTDDAEADDADDEDDGDDVDEDEEEASAPPRSITKNQHLNAGGNDGSRTLDPSQVPIDILKTEARAHASAFDVDNSSDDNNKSSTTRSRGGKPRV